MNNKKIQIYFLNKDLEQKHKKHELLQFKTILSNMIYKYILEEINFKRNTYNLEIFNSTNLTNN